MTRGRIERDSSPAMKFRRTALGSIKTPPSYFYTHRPKKRQRVSHSWALFITCRHGKHKTSHDLFRACSRPTEPSCHVKDVFVLQHVQKVRVCVCVCVCVCVFVFFSTPAVSRPRDRRKTNPTWDCVGRDPQTHMMHNIISV